MKDTRVYRLRILMVLAAVSGAMLAGCSDPEGPVVPAVFEESFEEELDFDVWRPSDESVAYRFAVRDDVGAIDGDNAAMVLVRSGDHALVGRSGDATERAEIESQQEIVRFDEEVWYTFSVFIPSSYPRADNRAVIHQIKENTTAVDGEACPLASPFFAVEVRGADEYAVIVIRVTYSVDCSHDKPMRRQFTVPYDEWHTIQVHMLPSHDPETGFVTAWINGIRAFEWVGGLGYATFGKGFVDTQPRFGIYRNSIAEPARLFFDSIVFWDVEPSADYRWIAEREGEMPLPATIATARERELVLHWTFDETDIDGLTVSDVSGNGNDGTLNAEAELTAGRFGTALALDGFLQYTWTDDDLSIPLDGDTSISAWFQFTGEPNVRIVDLAVPESVGFQIRTSGGRVGFDNSGGPDMEAYAEPLVNDGRWHHAVWVREGDTYLMYVDGRRATDASSGLPTTYSRLMVGARNDEDGPDRFFPGLVDDVRVFAGALTAEEVLELYDG